MSTPRVSFDPSNRPDRIGARRDQYERVIQYDANGAIVPYGTDGKPARATVGATRPAQPQNNIGANNDAFREAFHWAPQQAPTPPPVPAKVGNATPIPTPLAGADLSAPVAVGGAAAAIGGAQSPATAGLPAMMAGAVSAGQAARAAAPRPAVPKTDAFHVGPQTRTAPTGHGIEAWMPTQDGGRWVPTTSLNPVRLPTAESRVINPGVTGFNSTGQRMHDTPGGGALEYDPRHDAGINHLDAFTPTGVPGVTKPNPLLPSGSAGGVMIPDKYRPEGGSNVGTISYGHDNTNYHSPGMPIPPPPPAASMAQAGLSGQAAADAYTPPGTPPVPRVTTSAPGEFPVSGGAQRNPQLAGTGAGIQPQPMTPAAPPVATTAPAAPVAAPAAPAARPTANRNTGLDFSAFSLDAFRDLGHDIGNAMSKQMFPGAATPTNSQPQARPTPDTASAPLPNLNPDEEARRKGLAGA